MHRNNYAIWGELELIKPEISEGENDNCTRERERERVNSTVNYTNQ